MLRRELQRGDESEEAGGDCECKQSDGVEELVLLTINILGSVQLILPR